MTSQQPTAETLIGALHARSPDLVRLATCLALACRVEPALLRRMRLDLGLPTELEADLWHGPLVQTRTPDWLVLEPTLAAELRRRERARPGATARLALARETIRQAHLGAPRTVRLEDEILWQGRLPAREARSGIEALLGPVVERVAADDRERQTLVRWFAGAASRLPEPAPETQAYALLTFLAGVYLDGRRIGEADWRPAHLHRLPGLLPQALTPEQKTRLWVALDPGGIAVSPVELAGFQVIELPRTDPLLLEVRPKGEGPWVEVLNPGRPTHIPLATISLRLRTALGDTYVLTARAEPADGSASAPPRLAYGDPQTGKPADLMLLDLDFDRPLTWEPPGDEEGVEQLLSSSREGAQLSGFATAGAQVQVRLSGDQEQATPTPDPRVVIVYAGEDRDTAEDLNRRLDAAGVRTWMDTQDLEPGIDWQQAIVEAMAPASRILFVLSEATARSKPVRAELRHALQAQDSEPPGPRLIPLWLDRGAADAFPELGNLKGIRLRGKGVDLADKLPQILEAIDVEPVAELRLSIEDAAWEETEQGPVSTANLTRYYRPWPGADLEEGSTSRLRAPLDSRELAELDWYLGRSYDRPDDGGFLARARQVERSLPDWGRRLYQALHLGQAWRQFTGAKGQRRPERWHLTLSLSQADPGWDADAGEALLALPWELIQDGKGFLVQSERGPTIRRVRPTARVSPVYPVSPTPLRVLLVSPRPSGDHVPPLDPRLSLETTASALSALGRERLDLDLCDPPTLGELTARLSDAQSAGRPYQILHYDGHGDLDPDGRSRLWFEQEDESVHWIQAGDLVAGLAGIDLPLLLLETCQGAGLAQALSRAGSGVRSIVAMTHAIHLEAARGLVQTFYRALARGERIGSALRQGQQWLAKHAVRAWRGQERERTDWFLPVLYQQGHDHPLVDPDALGPAEPPVQRLLFFPDPPDHGFVGREAELSAARRRMIQGPGLVVTGMAGIGKTHLATELARWLVAAGAVERAVFLGGDPFWDQEDPVSGIAGALGEEGLGSDPDALAQRLADDRTLLLLDACERGIDESARDAWRDPGLAVLVKMLMAEGSARLLLTSRVPLPPPLLEMTLPLSALSDRDAEGLVGTVSRDDPRRDPVRTRVLVETVQAHPTAMLELVQAAPATEEILGALDGRFGSWWREVSAKSAYQVGGTLTTVDQALQSIGYETLERLAPLLLFNGGATAWAIRRLFERLGSTDADPRQIAEPLVFAGLAEWSGDYLHLHPVLGAGRVLDKLPLEDNHLLDAWRQTIRDQVRAMVLLVRTDPAQAFALVRLEQVNLLALARRGTDLLTLLWMEALPANGSSPLLAKLVKDLRRQAAGAPSEDRGDLDRETLVGAELAEVQSKLEEGDGQGALEMAEGLGSELRSSAAEANDPYGRAAVLSSLGRCRAAMGELEHAGALFLDALNILTPPKDDTPAKRSLRLDIRTRIADLHLGRGRLEEARDLYEQSLTEAETVRDPGMQTRIRGKMAALDLRRQDYDSALAAYGGVLERSAAMGDRRTMTAARHQIGQVYKAAGRPDQAEDAYAAALTDHRLLGDRPGELATLTELGSLYAIQGLDEAALAFHEQALGLGEGLRSPLLVSRLYNNLGHLLLRLNRLEEAGERLSQALSLSESAGPAAEGWKTWSLLAQLHRIKGDESAAEEALDQARSRYLAYRRAGGYPRTPCAALAAELADALAQGSEPGLHRALRRRARRPETPDYQRRFMAAMQRVIQGERDPHRAAAGLDFDDAAELELVLEQLPRAEEDPRVAD